MCQIKVTLKIIIKFKNILLKLKLKLNIIKITTNSKTKFYFHCSLMLDYGYRENI